MGPTLSDIQETLKKHDLLFWMCPELSGHGSLEEEFIFLGKQNSIETVQPRWIHHQTELSVT